MKKMFLSVVLSATLLTAGTLTYAGTMPLEVPKVAAFGANVETVRYNNGDMYVGPLKNEKMNGNGTYVFADGSTYVGDFVDDYFQGRGKITYINGKMYTGGFYKDAFHGTGTLVVNGLTYVGNFKDGVKEGKGKYTSSLGVTLEGIFKNDLLNGPVTYTFGKDLVIKGTCKEDKLVGKASVTYKKKNYNVDFSKSDEVTIANEITIYDFGSVHFGTVETGYAIEQGVTLSLYMKIEGNIENGEYINGKTTSALGDEQYTIIDKNKGMTGIGKNYYGDIFSFTGKNNKYMVSGRIEIGNSFRNISYVSDENGIGDVKIDNVAYKSVLEEGMVSKMHLTNAKGETIVLVANIFLKP